MDTTSTILIISGIAICVFVIIYIIALFSASKSIFHGSGAPVDMANVVLQSILAAGQIIVGIAILAMITILIVTDKISSEVGLPIIAAITGYLVGRNFNNKIKI